ncbi:putative toxin-antitoxin system toxin component, PIN family [Geobacter sp.]|uniref:putative toxin-antitoxin system toxin component, PIN family n=1 Tax=Geobacter sp. TaxID=46610 RepID=UPI0027B8AB4D|nr:putative toxin-antitoxin system toxin component, PIN family [Geobacter sp.]
MIIVLDTNVLVAGLLSPFGTCGEIVRMVSAGMLTLCLDARIITEYAEVLARPKFRFDQEKVAALLDQIEACGIAVASAPLADPLPDPDDEPFLEVALAGGAECLVTGNHVHFSPSLCQGVIVLSPAKFIELYRNRQRM